MKERIAKMTHSLPAKAGAFILVVIAACLAVGCAVGAVALVELEAYDHSEDQVRQEALAGQAAGDAWRIWDMVAQGYDADAYCLGKNISYEVYGNDRKLAGNSVLPIAADEEWAYVFDFSRGQGGLVEEYQVRIKVNEALPHGDSYYQTGRLVHLLYSLRYAIYFIGLLSLALAVACFIFLMAAAGRRAGREEVAAGPLVRLPYDLYLAIAVALAGLAVMGIDELTGSISNDMIRVAIVYFSLAMIPVAGTYLAMNFAVRVKLGSWWKNTLIYRLLVLLVRWAKALCRGIAALFSALPLVWKTALVWWAFSLLTLFSLLTFGRGELGVLWLIANIILFPAVIYLALTLRDCWRPAWPWPPAT